MGNVPPTIDSFRDTEFPSKIRLLITHKIEFEGHKPEVLRPILTTTYITIKQLERKRKISTETKEQIVKIGKHKIKNIKTRNFKTRRGTSE